MPHSKHSNITLIKDCSYSSVWLEGIAKTVRTPSWENNSDWILGLLKANIYSMLNTVLGVFISIISLSFKDFKWGSQKEKTGTQIKFSHSG